MKRGQSGLSLMLGVNKPCGMSSHDVVNRCRRIFGEKRVGHAGTLDPLASGVLPIFVGPATRLEAFMVGRDKQYRVRVMFGAETNTDDREGEVTATSKVPSKFRDRLFAAESVANLQGVQYQIPPAYSAIKVNGKRAYKLAREGKEVELEPRKIEITSASLLEVGENLADATVWWDVLLSVSKGTYIRSIARDLGRDLGCPAHVALLERTRVGALQLSDCLTLETIEEYGVSAALDPVVFLQYRYIFVDEHEDKISNGVALDPSDLVLHYCLAESVNENLTCCTGNSAVSNEPLCADEYIALIASNKLKAIYRFDEARNLLVPQCVFFEGVKRGTDF